MLLSDMRERLYELKYNVEFNTRYWTEIESKSISYEIIIRAILIFGSLVSLIALFAQPDYLIAATIISAISGIVSNLILPAIGWTEKVRMVSEVKGRWIDLEREVKALWHDLEAEKNVTKKSIESCEKALAEIAKSKVGWTENSKIKGKVVKDMMPYYPDNNS